MRPIIVDPEDGPCEICAVRREIMDVKDESVRRVGVRCDDCTKLIPVYRDMGGSGFESATVDHIHLVSDAVKKHPIKRELCALCYLIDYAKQFPAAEPPELPPEV